MGAYSTMPGVSPEQAAMAQAFDDRLGETIQDMLIAEVKNDAASGGATLAAAGNAIARALAQVVGAAVSGAVIDPDTGMPEKSEREARRIADLGADAAMQTFEGYLAQVVSAVLAGEGERVIKTERRGDRQ